MIRARKERKVENVIDRGAQDRISYTKDAKGAKFSERESRLNSVSSRPYVRLAPEADRERGERGGGEAGDLSNEREG
jgi:hypothetical protein